MDKDLLISKGYVEKNFVSPIQIIKDDGGVMQIATWVYPNFDENNAWTIDAHGDAMKAVEVEIMAHRWLAHSGLMDTDHDMVPDRKTYAVESTTLFKNEVFPAGGWYIVFNVEDEGKQKRARNGELNAVSFQAMAKAEDGEIARFLSDARPLFVSLVKRGANKQTFDWVKLEKEFHQKEWDCETIRPESQFCDDTVIYRSLPKVDGIRIVSGKLKSEFVPDGDNPDELVVQSVRFDNQSAWTISKAKSWIADNLLKFSDIEITKESNLKDKIKKLLGLSQKEGRQLSDRNVKRLTNILSDITKAANGLDGILGEVSGNVKQTSEEENEMNEKQMAAFMAKMDAIEAKLMTKAKTDPDPEPASDPELDKRFDDISKKFDSLNASNEELAGQLNDTVKKNEEAIKANDDLKKENDDMKKEIEKMKKARGTTNAAGQDNNNSPDPKPELSHVMKLYGVSPGISYRAITACFNGKPVQQIENQ